MEEENDLYKFVKPIENSIGSKNFNDISKVIKDNIINTISSLEEYKELIMMYTCALKEVKTKFEVLDSEFNVKHSRNPISSINTRVKSNSSIFDKIKRKNANFSVQTVKEKINDVAGIRIICSYIDDIYVLANALLEQDDITLVSIKDYIKEPKENGYRSLHIVVSIPVFFSDHKEQLKVEVQIRTIAMDFWASLEHQLKYKHDITNSDIIMKELRQSAEEIANNDIRMLEIRKQIEKSKTALKQDKVLFKTIMDF